MNMCRPLSQVKDHYKLIRFLLSVSGVWPFLTSLQCRIFTGVTLILVISQMIPQVIGFIEVLDDLDKVIECLSPFGLTGLCVIKYTNLCMNKDKIRRLLIRIQQDWDHAVCGPENIIMHRYAEIGLKGSKFYTIMIYFVTCLFVLLPIVQSIPTWNSETNRTESNRKLPFVSEYYIDQYEYFYHLIILSFFCVNCFMLTMIGADVLFFVCIQHGCAKFDWLKYELTHATDYGNLNEERDPKKIDEFVLRKIKICVIVHQEAIGFANDIESIYSITQLFQTGLTCTVISITALHAITKLGNPDELTKYFGVIVAVSLHLLFYSWSSQKLMDQSISVCEAAYEMEWYNASISARKLVLQIIIRSLSMCKITSGNLYLMSMENYTSVLTNAISLFTVLSTVQEQSIQR